MSIEQVLISNDNGNYRIKISGRANFECAVPLRQLSRCLGKELSGLWFDAADCTFMDSTFMGVMSMLALQAKKLGSTATICGAPEHVRLLLKGLGVDKVFIFTDADGAVQVDSWHTLPVDRSKLSTAETIAEAHQTLVDADSSNEAKFKSVIDYAKSDVERLKNEKEK